MQYAEETLQALLRAVRELMEHQLGEFARLDGRLRAIEAAHRAEAIERARQAEEQRAKGKASNEKLHRDKLIRDAHVLSLIREQLERGQPPHAVAAIVAAKVKCSPHHVREIRRKNADRLLGPSATPVLNGVSTSPNTTDRGLDDET
ncbi:MAG: hypothetical protein M0015_10850 [Betaproteobacteria bacterium]|nr:hypothetical protein [Betaproteobacteria bacterium]